MRENNTFCVDFFTHISIYLSIYLSLYPSVRFFVGATGHSFVAIFTLNGSNDVISQPLVPLDGHINIAPYYGSQIALKPHFWGVNRRFQAKRTKYYNFHIIKSAAAIQAKCSTTSSLRGWSPYAPDKSEMAASAILEKNV